MLLTNSSVSDERINWSEKQYYGEISGFKTGICYQCIKMHVKHMGIEADSDEGSDRIARTPWSHSARAVLRQVRVISLSLSMMLCLSVVVFQ